MIGSDAAKCAARCVTTGWLFALLGIAWVVAYVAAIATQTASLAGLSTPHCEADYCAAEAAKKGLSST
jgi:hypothetical protein